MRKLITAAGVAATLALTAGSAVAQGSTAALQLAGVQHSGNGASPAPGLTHFGAVGNNLSIVADGVPVAFSPDGLCAASKESRVTVTVGKTDVTIQRSMLVNPFKQDGETMFKAVAGDVVMETRANCPAPDVKIDILTGDAGVAVFKASGLKPIVMPNFCTGPGSVPYKEGHLTVQRAGDQVSWSTPSGHKGVLAVDCSKPSSKKVEQPTSSAAGQLMSPRERYLDAILRDLCPVHRNLYCGQRASQLASAMSRVKEKSFAPADFNGLHCGSQKPEILALKKGAAVWHDHAKEYVVVTLGAIPADDRALHAHAEDSKACQSGGHGHTHSKSAKSGDMITIVPTGWSTDLAVHPAIIALSHDGKQPIMVGKQALAWPTTKPVKIPFSVIKTGQPVHVLGLNFGPDQKPGTADDFWVPQKEIPAETIKGLKPGEVKLSAPTTGA